MPAAQRDIAPLAHDLTIIRRTEAASEILVLDGDIDLASAPILERALHDVERSRPRRIVLDLADLEFLDSTAIHLLIDAQQRAATNGHRLILTNVPARAERLFTLTKIRSRLNIE